MNSLLAIGDLQETFFLAIQLAAGIGGAFVGWFVAGPVTRLLYRLAFQRPVPGGLLPWTKMGGALLLGFLFFSLVRLGGGGLGWGSGPGDGGGAGLGPGPGGSPGTGLAKDGKDRAKDGKDITKQEKSTRDEVEIELISSQKYKQDGKYYLLNRAEPAMGLGEIDDYFAKNHKKIIAKVVLTEDSVGAGQGALGRLRELTKKYEIPTVEPPE